MSLNANTNNELHKQVSDYVALFLQTWMEEIINNIIKAVL